MPTTVLSRQRSWIAIFAVLAMVASLMAIATPAQAALQDTSATCPDSIPSAGYTDLGGLDATTVQAIDCVTFYSISKGVSVGAFNPNGSTPRWQMALFLTRTASVLGITLPDGSDQDFTDIGGFDAETQTAINQIKQLDISKGTSATTFNPDGIVSRWQMALFLTRLLAAHGIALPDGSDQGFNDIGGLDAETQKAINQTAQLGVSAGTSATAFSPTPDTLRWQMALFLTRTGAVDDVIPNGLTLSVDKASAGNTETVKGTITYAEKYHAKEGQRLDVFAAKAINANGTLTLDGNATLGTYSQGTNGTQGTIELDDPQTNASGQVTFKLTYDNTKTGTVILGTWKGAVGDVFDDDVVPAAYKVTTNVVFTQGPADLTGVVDDGVPMAPYGGTEGFTTQLRDSAGDKLKLAGEQIIFDVEQAGSNYTQALVATDANGVAKFSYSVPDPTTGNDAPVDHDVDITLDLNKNGIREVGEPRVQFTITWDDAKSVVTSASASLSVASELVNGQVSVTGKILDQYGAGVSGLEIQFDPASDPSGIRTTGSAGTAVFTYTGPNAKQVDPITVQFDTDDDGVFEGPADDLADVVKTMYWVEKGTDGVWGGDVLRIGTNYVDVDTDLVRLFWDSNDQFNNNGAPATQAVFEASLDVGDEFDADPYEDDVADVSTFWNLN